MVKDVPGRIELPNSDFADHSLATWVRHEMSDAADSAALHSVVKVFHHAASLRQRYSTAPHRTSGSARTRTEMMSCFQNRRLSQLAHAAKWSRRYCSDPRFMLIST